MKVATITEQQKQSPLPKLNTYLALAVIIFCGGYSLGFFAWMTPLLSIIFLITLTIGVIFKIGVWQQKHDFDLGPFQIIMLIIAAIVLILIAAALIICHLFWSPRIAAGFSAGLTLISTTICFVLDLKFRLAERQ